MSFQYMKLIGALLAVSLALAWVYFRPGSQSREAAGETKLVFAMGTDVNTLDPHDTGDSPSAIANHHIYDGLVAFNERMEIEPQLARRWDVSEDGYTWTFYLRRGVRFHDGTPFDARAVKVNLDRLTGEESRLARKSLIAPYLKFVEVVDDDIVRLHLRRPFAALLTHLAHGGGAMISPAALERYGRGVSRNPVGTGPFRLREWIPGDRLVLERNRDYWGPPPAVDVLVLKPVPDAPSRVIMLETGEADVSYPIPATDVPWLRRRKDIDLLVTPSQRMIYIGINTKRPPLSDVRVRRSLNYAVDKEAIVDRVLLGMGTVADSPMPPGTWGHAATGAYRYDPIKARRLLDEAGVPPGTSIKLWTPQGRYLGDWQTAEAVAGYLEKAGLRVDLRIWEWGSYLAALSDKEKAGWDLFLLGWISATGDADWFLRPLFSTGSISNEALYENPRVDELLSLGTFTFDPGERRRIYGRAQQLIFEDAPWIFLHVVDQTVGLRKGVTGVRVFENEMISLREARRTR